MGLQISHLMYDPRQNKKEPLNHLSAGVLLNFSGEHNNDPTPNLLSIWRRRSNLITDEQCEQVTTATLWRIAKFQ